MTTPAAVLDLSDAARVMNGPLRVLCPDPYRSPDDRDAQNHKLFTLLCNYLSLSQFELARPVITELFFACPERILHLLRSIIAKTIPDQWLFNKTVPSIGHLQWLALVEYGQLYANVFDKATALTPSVPLIVASKDPRFAALAHSSAVTRHPINPLGFITHDQLVVQVMALELRRVTAAGCFVRVEQEGDQDGFFTTPVTALTAAGHAEYPTATPPKCKLEVNIADAQLVFTVATTAKLPQSAANKSGAAAGAQSNNSRSGGGSGTGATTLFAKAVIGLHQLRAKDKYHIWVPLIPLHASDTAAADQQLGRIRIRLRWRQQSLAPRRDGSARLFSDRAMLLMETDILLAHAAVTYPALPPAAALAAAESGSGAAGARGATAARNTAREPLLRPEHVSEIRSYCLEAVGRKDPSLLIYQRPAADPTAALLRGDEPAPDDDGNGNNADGNGADTGAAGGLRGKYKPTHRIQHSLSALRRLVREHPSLGHALCAHLAAVRPQDPTWVYLYAELIFEMLLRQEHPQALQALLTLVHDIYPGDEFFAALSNNTPEAAAAAVAAAAGAGPGAAGVQQLTGPRAMMREVYRALVHYVHDDPAARQHLFRLLSHKRLVTGLDAPELSGQELLLLSREEVLARQRRVLSRKCRVYGALVGNEQVLKQFCALEDFYLHGTAAAAKGIIAARTLQLQPGTSAAAASTGAAAPQSKIALLPGTPREGVELDVPLFFHSLADALREVETLQARAVRDYGVAPAQLPAHVREPLFSLREEAFSAFWSDYYSFTRSRRVHVYEFPLKCALELVGTISRIELAPAWHVKGYPCAEGTAGVVTAAERAALTELFWSALETLLAPFNFLRPLVALLAWDRVDGSAALRGDVMRRVWRPYHQTLANAAVFESLMGSVLDTDATPAHAASEAARAAMGNGSSERADSLTASAATAPASARRSLQRFECAEPKLVLHCNRLELAVELSEMVTNKAPSMLRKSPEEKERLGQWLLTQLTQQSIVRALQPYLAELDPALLVHAVKRHIELELNVRYAEDGSNGTTNAAGAPDADADVDAGSGASVAAAAAGGDAKNADGAKADSTSTAAAGSAASADGSGASASGAAASADAKPGDARFASTMATWLPEQRALFEATGLAPDGQILNPTRVLRAADATLAAARGGSRGVARTALGQTAVTELVHDLHVLCAYYAVRSVLRVLRAHSSGRVVKPAVQSEALEAARMFMLSMQYRAYQVSTLEKIYCLLFTTEADLRSSVATDGEDPDAPLLSAVKDKAAKKSGGKGSGDKKDAAASADEELRQLDALMDTGALGKQAGDRFVLRGEVLLSLLQFLADTTKTMLAAVARDDAPIDVAAAGASPATAVAEVAQLKHRLHAVAAQVEEGLWRAHKLHAVLQGEAPTTQGTLLARNFTMGHVVAPLHHLSSYLVHMEQLDDPAARLCAPVLPDALAEHSREFAATLNKAVTDAVAIAAAAANVSASSTGVEHLKNAMAAMVSGQTDLSSQVVHAERMKQDATLWRALCELVERRIDESSGNTTLNATLGGDTSDADMALARRAQALLDGVRPHSMVGIAIVPAPDRATGSGKAVSAASFVQSIDAFIENHYLALQSSAAAGPGAPAAVARAPKHDELLEQKYLFAVDLAVSYASALTLEQYQCLLDLGVQAATQLGQYCETALFSYLSEPALNAVEAAMQDAPERTRLAAQAALRAQRALKDTLAVRARLCALYISYAQRRRAEKDGVAVALLPETLGGPAGNGGISSAQLLSGSAGTANATGAYLAGVSAGDFTAAWRHYTKSIESSAAQHEALLPPCPFTAKTAIHVVRYLAESSAREALLASREQIDSAGALAAALSTAPTSAVAASLMSAASVLSPTGGNNAPHRGAVSAIDALTTDGTVDAVVGTVDSRLYAVLARAMLPALAAVRFAMPAAVSTLLEAVEAVTPANAVPGETRIAVANKTVPSALDEAIAVSTQYSRFLPTLARWVQWRAQAYQRLAQWVELVVRPGLLVLADGSLVNVHSGAVSVVQTLTDLLAKENAYRDAQAYTQMFLSYIETIRWLAQRGASAASSVGANTAELRQLTALRLAALDLADVALDDARSRDALVTDVLGQPCKTPLAGHLTLLVEELLRDLVPALGEATEQPLRAQLLLRIADPVVAGEFAQMWLPVWRDTEMSAAVAMRCFSALAAYVPTLEQHIQALYAKAGVAPGQGARALPEGSTVLTEVTVAEERLQHTLALRNALAHDYQMLLVYRTLQQAARQATRQRQVLTQHVHLGRALQGEAPPGAIPSPDELELQSKFPSWVDLRAAAEANLDAVVDQLLLWRHLGLALKLYSMRLAPVVDAESLGDLQAVSAGFVLTPSAEHGAGTEVRRRWFFGQDLAPLSGAAMGHNAHVDAATGGRTGMFGLHLGLGLGVADRGVQADFPLTLYTSWLSAMSAQEAETKSTPAGFDAESQAMQRRLAVKLESTCLAMLLSQGASARSRLRALQRVQELNGPNFNAIQVLHILKYLVILLDLPQSRLIVTDILHRRWAATAEQLAQLDAEDAETGGANGATGDNSHGDVDATSPKALRRLYPMLPPGDAAWLQMAHAASRMLSMLPARVQYDLCTLLEAGTNGAQTPQEIVEGLLRLDQPALVMAVFPRFKHLLSLDKLLLSATECYTAFFLRGERAVTDDGVGAGEVPLETGFYYLDLCLQFGQGQFQRVATKVLEIVQTLSPLAGSVQAPEATYDLTARLLVHKLLRYCHTYCYAHCDTQTQVRFLYYYRELVGPGVDAGIDAKIADAMQAQAALQTAELVRAEAEAYARAQQDTVAQAGASPNVVASNEALVEDAPEEDYEYEEEYEDEEDEYEDDAEEDAANDDPYN